MPRPSKFRTFATVVLWKRVSWARPTGDLLAKAPPVEIFELYGATLGDFSLEETDPVAMLTEFVDLHREASRGPVFVRVKE